MVLNYIHENLHENLTVNQLADYCHLNTDYFSRVFNENFGMRPNKYIQSKRIERAQLLLLSTNNSLKQIAEKVGLDNPCFGAMAFYTIYNQIYSFAKTKSKSIVTLSPTIIWPNIAVGGSIP